MHYASLLAFFPSKTADKMANILPPPRFTADSSDSSIQESKKPERNLVAESGFHIIRNDKAVGQVFDLVKPFTRTADFENEPSIDDEITL